MDMIAFNAEFDEIGRIDPLDLDIEAGGDNIITLMHDIEMYGAYIPETEFGGPLEMVKTDSGSKIIKYTGSTWRGLLAKKVLEPAAGAAYFTTAAGDANAILIQLIGDRFDGRIRASTIAANIEIPAHQYSRYCTLLEGIEEICRENGLRLALYADRVDNKVTCTASLVAAQVLDEVYGEDNRYKMTWTDDGTGINHLICLGRGELENRTVLHLYADASGTISTTQTITGFAEREEVYDYGSIEDDDDLEKEGRKHFRDLLSSKKLEVIEIPAGYNIGDSVTGRKDGFQITAPIDRIIVKLKNGVYSAEYRVKED